MYKNKSVVITGGSSGLGFALAKYLAKHGAILTLIARDESKLLHAMTTIKKISPNAIVYTESVDLRDPSATKTAFDNIAKNVSSIDILFNNAGILREGYFEHLNMQDFQDVMNINFFGLVHATRAALPHLKRSNGILVNIASIAGLSGVFGYTPYCSAKHALVGFTESLYYELSPQGIDVRLICPSEFDSPMVDELEVNRTPENRVHTRTIPIVDIDTIVSGIFKGLSTNKFLIIPGSITKAAAYGMRYLPSISRTIISRNIKKVYQGPTTTST